MKNVSDNQLVQLSQTGDHQAYASLVERYTSTLFAVCLGRLGNTHDAEDLCQEIFIKAFQQICFLRDGKKFRAWLLRMGRNACVDWQRKQKTQKTVPLGNQGIDRTASQHKEHDQLEMAICQLPDHYRIPLIQFYYENCNAKHLAQSLNLSISAVNTRLHRGRQRLKKLLSSKGGDV